MDEVEKIVEEGVNDLIVKYQEKFGIKDGGIGLLAEIELDNIKTELYFWLKQAFPVGGAA